jgi:hypothetical protein
MPLSIPPEGGWPQGALRTGLPRKDRFRDIEPRSLLSAAPLSMDLIAANLPDVDPPASPDPTAQEIPGSWDDIGPGHVVIAKETSECGWWEAVVVERTGDLVTVRYRDYPMQPRPR